MKDQGRHTILLVDDSLSALNMVRQMLTDNGYHVLGTTSGEKALKRLRVLKPDLILLDIVMTGMNGFETCVQIRELIGGDVPIIFLTVVGDTFDKVRAFQVGAVDYITKPVKPEELLARVNTHIDLYKLRVQLRRNNFTLEDKVKERTAELQQANELLEIEVKERKAAQEELSDYQKRLEQLVADRTEELQAVNEELSQLNEELLTYTDQLHVQKKDLQAAFKKLKQAQNQLIQTEKMASLGVLTAGVAHEINNPLNFITASVYGLERIGTTVKEVCDLYSALSPETTKEQLVRIDKFKHDTDFDYQLRALNQMLGTIKEGALRISSIVQNLKTFSDSDDSITHKIDINKSLEACLTMLQHLCGNRIELIRDYEELPELNAYPGKLTQAFVNLITNAIQAIPDKGTITISTRLRTLPAQKVVVVIKDTGVGIPEGIKNKLFEAFFTTKAPGEGTGLGLYTSYGIILHHHGEILINSAEGKGTEVIVKIPLDAD